ncbi:tail completion protein gp17 [Undibacterium curvum]|uniref:tail completion protein gp17 n=1 Tax=Undibacterium curvum TaxID=2762294 RepID=UPI003D0C14C0
MQIEEVLYAAISSVPELSTLPIRPFVAAEDDLAPYIIFTRLPGVRIGSLTGDSGLVNSHFQIDVYDHDLLEVGRIMSVVRQAILSEVKLGAIHVAERKKFEPETKLFRCSEDFSFWFSE